MNLLASLGTSLSWLAGGLLFIIFAWLVVRAASHAFFKTKLEYDKDSVRELRKEKNEHG